MTTSILLDKNVTLEAFPPSSSAMLSKDTTPVRSGHESLSQDDSSSNGCYVPGMVAAGDDSDSDSESSSRLNPPVDCIQAPLLATTSDVAAPLRRTRRVRFGGVNIRVYSITLGDHPLAAMYPISLDWSYNAFETQSLQTYEQQQQQTRQRTNAEIPAGRGIQAPKLPVTDRMSRLVEITGMSSQQLFQAERKRQAMLGEEKRLARASRRFV